MTPHRKPTIKNKLGSIEEADVKVMFQLNFIRNLRSLEETLNLPRGGLMKIMSKRIDARLLRSELERTRVDCDIVTLV